MADDLRTLAQAVVDADCPDHAGGARKRRFASARLALYAALPNPVDGARAILAALDAVDAAADARGYARAMGEVIAHSSQRDRECEAGRWDPHAAGQQYAWEECWEWARERAAAVNR